MAEEERPTRFDFEKYAYANLAAQLVQGGEEIYVSGAADLLREELNYGDDGEALYKGFVIDEDGEFISEQARNRFISIYNTEFLNKLSEAKVSELQSWYEPALKGATKDQKDAINAELEKFGGENYGELSGKITHLHYTVEKAPTGEVSEDEKKEAKEELKKYEGFEAVQGMLQKYTFEEMRTKAVKASKKKRFNDLEEMLKE